jgi:hypothetical protein
VLTPFCWPESNIIACVNGLHEMNLAQSETLCTWRRSLHGTWETSSASGVEFRTGS